MINKILQSEGDVNNSDERLKWVSEFIDDKTRELLEQDSRYFLHQALSTPCLDVIESSKGSGFTTISGKRILDFHGNNVHQLGYCNSGLTRIIKENIDHFTFSPRRFTNLQAINFATKLAGILPGDLNRSLFAPAGTLAVGMAMKLARIVTGKYKLISHWDSFHGASLDSISAGGEEEFSRYMGPLLPGIIHIPPVNTYRGIFGDSEADQMNYAKYLEYIIEKEGDVGAFISETIRNTDVQVPSVNYWKKVREICNKHNVLLILDEIPTALARTGEMFAFMNFEIEPDVLCLGKGLGGGIIPFAAIVTRDRYNVAKDISLGHYTHEKSPLGSMIALAVIESIENENIIQRVKTIGAWMQHALNSMKQDFPIIGDVRGIGMLWGIELVKDQETKEKAVRETEKVMYYCLRHGLNFKITQGNIIQLSPALTIDLDDLKLAFSILRDAFNFIHNSR